MIARFPETILPKPRVSDDVGASSPQRPTHLVRAIRLGLALVAANAALPAQAAIICPISLPLTVTGSETIDSTNCEIQATGSIDIQEKGSVEINNTGSLSAYGDLNVSFGGQVMNAGTIHNQIGASLNNAGSLTNNNVLNNFSVLTNTSSAKLYNDSAINNHGLIENAGFIYSTGSISGTGTLNNTGSLNIENGGSANIAQSDNLTGGILSGGSWNLVSGTKAASLAFGDGSSPITTLAANASVTLNGSGTQFQQLENNLSELEGVLVLKDHNFSNPTGHGLNIGEHARFSNYFGTINNAGSLINDGLFGDFKGVINNTGTITNNNTLANVDGTLTNQTGAALINNSVFYNDLKGNVNNQLGAVLNNQSGGTLGNYAESSLSNSGTLNNYAYALLSNFGNIVNTGAINNIRDNDSIGEIRNQIGASFDNSGDLNTAGLFKNQGSVNNQPVGTFTNTGLFYNHGSFTNQLDATVNNQYILVNYSDSTMTNKGTFNNASGAGLYNISGAKFTNAGVFNNQAGATLANGSTLINDGLLNNDGILGIDTPASIEGNGQFIQREGKTIVSGLLQQPTLDIQGGVITGEGTLMGDVIIDRAAKLAPGIDNTIVDGSELGKLTVDGGIGINGSLMIEIAGIETGSYDELDVMNGVVTFGVGSLISININSLFAPGGGMIWDFLFSDNHLLGLNEVNYQVSGLSPSLAFVLNEVEVGGRYALEFTIPEPDSLSLFGLGGLLLMRWRRCHAA